MIIIISIFQIKKTKAWFPRPEDLGNMAVTETETPGTAAAPKTRGFRKSGDIDSNNASDLGGTSSGNKDTGNATGKGSGGWKVLAVKHN